MTAKPNSMSLLSMFFAVQGRENELNLSRLTGPIVVSKSIADISPKTECRNAITREVNRAVSRKLSVHVLSRIKTPLRITTLKYLTLTGTL